MTAPVSENILQLGWLLDELGLDLTDNTVCVCILEDLIAGLEWRSFWRAYEGVTRHR